MKQVPWIVILQKCGSQTIYQGKNKLLKNVEIILNCTVNV